MTFNRRDIAGTLNLLMILKGMLLMILYCEYSLLQVYHFLFGYNFKLIEKQQEYYKELILFPYLFIISPSVSFFICIISIYIKG